MTVAANSLHIDKTYSTLKLIGKFDCNGSPTNPDLSVLGGAKINKNLCVSGNIFGDLFGNVTAEDIFTETLTATDFIKTDNSDMRYRAIVFALILLPDIGHHSPKTHSGTVFWDITAL